MRTVLVLLLCLGLVGCATASKMNRLSLGMTKAEVIKVMGNPQSTKAQQETEVLEYQLYPHSDTWWREAFWVELLNGRVVRYGRAGDFGSAIRPDITIEHR